MRELVLASGNAKKRAELEALLPGVRVYSQTEFGVADAEEPFGTFLENALTKARHAARCTGRPALADDSGLCVEALGGAPGVQSARWASLAGGARSDAANNQKLIEQMRGQTNRNAQFVCVLVAVRHAEDPQPLVGMGAWPLIVLDAADGEGGFGYDPLVAAADSGVSVARMGADLKNENSHRARAMRALKEQLTNVWGWR
ncbi:non-canonical purine NTP pyrophosphatase [Inhella gelatinilytica]|uniref:dITP/XTP pyrophosphatase n=1 Tax=Inhella gelatinilytica TaxID=2795030 RepID=A0A931IV93_9BURK|nr:non-canonical purine NTP pyrophosphatase [Inhella gelatinilytica]MBH9553417.1 non-canonical purine NTP pyrophosphatase [Inhella gelatinilytica]